MPDWGSTTLAVLALVIIVLLLPVAWLVARRRWLALRGWVIECSLRLNDSTRAPPGCSSRSFHEEDLELYRVFSFDIRPRVVIRRREAAISATRLRLRLRRLFSTGTADRER